MTARCFPGKPNLLLAAGSLLAAGHSTAPAATLLDLRFNEGSGAVTNNSGASGGMGTFADQNGSPVFSSNIPGGPFAPSGNVSSVDFGPIGPGEGSRAIDFPASTAAPTFGLSAFTVTGWLNLRDGQIGPGGNRVLTTWPGGFGSTRGGFEVVQESNGRLRFSVNEAPDFPGPGPFSSAGTLTIDAATAASNWVFFGVTYDAGNPGDAGDGTVNFYFGNGSTAAALDVIATYDRGLVLDVPAGFSATATVGNFTTDVGARFEAGGGSRVLRGLVDEIHFFDSALNEAQIRAVQTIPEPASSFLFTLGLAGLGARRRRQF